jgi:hypothetical protein
MQEKDLEREDVFYKQDSLMSIRSLSKEQEDQMKRQVSSEKKLLISSNQLVNLRAFALTTGKKIEKSSTEINKDNLQMDRLP